MSQRLNSKTIGGILLLVAGIVVIMSSTWDLVETILATYPVVCPFCILGWFVSIVASVNAIGLALKVRFGVQALTEWVDMHWTKGNWIAKKGLSIAAILCGLIAAITAIDPLSSIIEQSFLGYEFFALRWIAHLIVGLASLISGIFSWRH